MASLRPKDVQIPFFLPVVHRRTREISVPGLVIREAGEWGDQVGDGGGDATAGRSFSGKMSG